MQAQGTGQLRKVVVSLIVKEYRELISGNRIEKIPETRKYEYLKIATRVVDPGDPHKNAEHLDLSCHSLVPGLQDIEANGRFVVSHVGDINGDGVDEVVVGITTHDRECFLVSYSLSGGHWQSQFIMSLEEDAVSFIRCIDVADLDNDNIAEIVIGTRPSGHVIVYDFTTNGCTSTVLDHSFFGTGCTNTRDILIADADNDGQVEVLVATALNTGLSGDNEKWGSTPGLLLMYKDACNRSQKRLLDDFRSQTHTRKIIVGDIDGDGKNELVVAELGIYQPAAMTIEPPSELYFYKISGDVVEKAHIDTLDKAIKSRGMDKGDVDGDGLLEIVCGTRSLPCYDESYLLIYKYIPEESTWHQELLDKSGERGFHTVCVSDVDGDGIDEIVASDDDKGQVNLYKKQNKIWVRTSLLQYDHPILVSSISIGDFG